MKEKKNEREEDLYIPIYIYYFIYIILYIYIILRYFALLLWHSTSGRAASRAILIKQRSNMYCTREIDRRFRGVRRSARKTVTGNNPQNNFVVSVEKKKNAIFWRCLLEWISFGGERKLVEGTHCEKFNSVSHERRLRRSFGSSRGGENRAVNLAREIKLSRGRLRRKRNATDNYRKRMSVFDCLIYNFISFVCICVCVFNRALFYFADFQKLEREARICRKLQHPNIGKSIRTFLCSIFFELYSLSLSRAIEVSLRYEHRRQETIIVLISVVSIERDMLILYVPFSKTRH